MWTWSSQPTSNFCFGSTATDHTALVAGTAITADQLRHSLQRLVAPLQTLKMCSPEITTASRLCASSHCHVSVWAWCLVPGQLANCFRQGCCELLCGDGIQGDRGRFHDPIASQDCCVPQHPQRWMEKPLQYTKDPTAISTTPSSTKIGATLFATYTPCPGQSGAALDSSHWMMKVRLLWKATPITPWQELQQTATTRSGTLFRQNTPGRGVPRLC